MIGNSVTIDLMLTIVMVAVGLRSLILSRDTGAKTAARWREELRALEGSLKSLITEASNSSATLDRRLVRRREELEELLKKIDSRATKIEARADEIDEEDDELYSSHQELPNRSWFLDEESPKKKSAPAPRAKKTSREVVRESDRDMFLELSEEVEDTVELSLPARRAPARASAPAKAAAAPTRRTAAPAPAKDIHSQVEVATTTAKKSRAKSQKQPTSTPAAPARATKAAAPRETEILTTPSIIDPTTYSVARRLLARGTELHVVARKLEIPLTEVRLLDKLMRSEGEGRATEEELSAGYRKTERIPAQKIVRPAVSGEDEAINLDDVEIFRETTTV